MPRGARLFVNNAYYHIVNRGNQKEKIFIEPPDFEKYLQLLKHYKRKYAFEIFGYCLMPNHVHIVLGAKAAHKLPKFMQSLTQTYTMWFNGKYNKVGHLWQGRFKCMIIQRDEYFLESIYYVEANPVRAGMVHSPKDYVWSSYKDRIFGNRNGLLDLPDST